MKYLILIFILTFWVSCKSQTNTNQKVTKPESKQSFKSQGKQEDYWACQLFEKEYENFEYSKFSGELKINDSKILFNETQCLEYFISEPKYRLIFEKGLLYPDIIFSNTGVMTILSKRENKNAEQLFRDTLAAISAINTSVQICCFEELTFLSDNPKIKRFRFWLFDSLSFNPSVYLFELTNETANEETSWESFIENSKLTFIKYGWTVL